MAEINYSLDDLPKYSPWPVRLLGLDPWEAKIKTPEEITREYNEKWGSLYKWVESNIKSITVDEANDYFFRNTKETLSFDNGNYYLVSFKEANRRYLNLIAKVLSSYMPASALVELGAGFGQVILNLSKSKAFDRARLIAGEYNQSGIDLIRILGKNQDSEIEVGCCDITKSQIIDLDVPENSLVFTSYVCHYVPKIKERFIDALIKLRPKAVVHFEPIYEHCNTDHLLGLLRKRYIEVNDYNTNIISLLHSQQRLGKIRILEEKPCIFGGNPLLTVSIVAWEVS